MRPERRKSGSSTNMPKLVTSVTMAGKVWDGLGPVCISRYSRSFNFLDSCSASAAVRSVRERCWARASSPEESTLGEPLVGKRARWTRRSA